MSKIDKSYRDIYEEACERAGRETWEPVEQSHIKDILAEYGMEWYVKHGYMEEDDWVKREPDDSDEPLWYYPSGNDPRIREFKRFHELLTANAPAGYEPYYIRVEPAGKAPATEYGGWKSERNCLTFQEALEWMRDGGNVGIASTPDDLLINLDIDDEDEASPKDVPQTLRARSRSRTGFHAWYFGSEDFPKGNIPTCAGELRLSWQYVVAPGSFVASMGAEVPDEAESPGYYTIEDEAEVARLDFEDLPEVFREVQEQEEDDTDEKKDGKADESAVEPSEERRSSVYDLTSRDIVGHVGGTTDTGDRWASPWHAGSDNTAFTDKGCISCFRCEVSHGALQALALLGPSGPSGEMGCQKIGKGHRNSSVGANRLKGDWQLSWYAWLGAKQEGLIPSDDPVPYVVIDGLADEHDLMKYPEESGRDTLPAATYNAVLSLIEDEYGVDPGREPVGGEMDEKQGEAKAQKQIAENEEEKIIASMMDDMLDSR